MRTSPLFYVAIALALAVTGALLFTNVRTTTALTQADRAYDQIEQGRAQRWSPGLLADRSYDAIENLRLKVPLLSAERTYEQLEALRAQRYSALADRSYDRIEDLRAMRRVAH